MMKPTICRFNKISIVFRIIRNGGQGGKSNFGEGFFQKGDLRDTNDLNRFFYMLKLKL